MEEGNGRTTGTIRRLDDRTIQRIAAGEVVERPASVVKELVENSIDAGASRIDVVVEGAHATDRIVVEDDGSGIEPEEVERAVEPHTTSKLASHDDLQSGVQTLGFRGEALHAISQVSRLTLSTRAPDESAGVEIVIDGGDVVEHRSVGVPVGTTVCVEGLFDPVPARRKFLDAPTTERTAVRRTVAHLALAVPTVAVSLTIEGSERFVTPGTGDQRAAVAAIHGRAVAETMLDVSANDDVPQAVDGVEGLVSDPATTRSTAAYMTTIINGRPVDSAALRRPIVDGFGDRLGPNRYPFAVVAVDVPPASVDVNVHPRKHEVHFDDPDAVMRAIRESVSSAVDADAALPTEPARANGGGHERGPGPRPAIDIGAVSTGGAQATLPGTDASLTERSYERLPNLEILGQAHDAFIVTQSGDGIVLIDQHAADERVQYERLREEVRAAGHHQRLATPVPIELSNEEVDLLAARRQDIESIGFRIETGEEPRVLAVPTVLGAALPPDAVSTAIHRLLEGGLTGDGDETVLELADPMLADLACHPAIKATQSLTDGSMVELLRALDACQSPWTCPHGRPTMIELTGSELAERFERDYPGARPCRDWDAL